MIDRLPPLAALRAFEAAARRLNFRQAAQELFVTPGAISQQIRLLEEHVGTPLFQREGRGVTLTEAGAAALPALRLGFEKLAEAARAMRQPQRRCRATVSVPPSFAAKWLVPRLERFNQAHPDVEIWVTADMALVDFASADVDLAIRYGAGAYPSLTITRLLEETALPVCAPALLEAAPILRPSDLANHTLLHDSGPSAHDGAPDWSMWLKAHGALEVDGTRGPRFNQASLVIESAVAGRGVALAKRALAEADLSARRLIAPFADGAAPLAYGYHLVWPQGRVFTPPQRCFIDWLLAEAQSSERARADHEAMPVFAGHAI